MDTAMEYEELAGGEEDQQRSTELNLSTNETAGIDEHVENLIADNKRCSNTEQPLLFSEKKMEGNLESSCTLKRNPKYEFSKNDLLKLLAQYEGELQARDIVIATLRAEKIKLHLSQVKQNDLRQTNPLEALKRDGFAITNSDRSDMCLRLVNQQLASLENIVVQQRQSLSRVSNVIKTMEMRHTKELEIAEQYKKRYELQSKKYQTCLEMERSRNKKIVLFLLEERKKIVTKYIEERKRSEDLAQILAEEKCRLDATAEGLEEESKKALRMEAELEKQASQFWHELQQTKQEVSKYKKRSEDLAMELVNSENLERQVGSVSGSPPIGTQHCSQFLCDASSSASNMSSINSCSLASMMTSVAKVVQPTATVSSVPVSSPMTGIARSVSPGQSHNVRFVMYSPASMPASHQIVSTVKFLDAAHSVVTTVALNTPIYSNTSLSSSVSSSPLQNEKKLGFSGPRLFTPHSIPTNNRNAPGEQSSAGIRKQLPLAIGRGVPPPVPPNKPVVPPKKEGILSRKFEAASHSDFLDVKAPTAQRCNIPVISKAGFPEKTAGNQPDIIVSNAILPEMPIIRSVFSTSQVPQKQRTMFTQPSVSTENKNK